MRLYSPHHHQQPSFKKRSWFSWELSGSAESLLVTTFCLLFIAGGTYLYSVNKSAVQGYEMRTLEKDMKELKKKNAELKVQEAEARALSRVEAGSAELRMEKINTTHSLLAPGTVAFR
ncbi:MAG: hypothetical protein ABI747_02740 [Candidatus Moraniibacteriota bacterium]